MSLGDERLAGRVGSAITCLARWRLSWRQRADGRCVIELRVRGGDVELVLAPGMVVDANELAVRYTKLAISRDAGDNTPETLRVRLVGQMKHGRIGTQWLAPRR